MELQGFTYADRARSSGSAPVSAIPAPAPMQSRAHAQAEAAPAPVSEEMMRRAIENANRALVQKSRELTFEFDDDVGRVIVKLIDRNTGEVLRQIPSSEAVQIARLLDQQRGVGALLRTHA